MPAGCADLGHGAVGVLCWGGCGAVQDLGACGIWGCRILCTHGAGVLQGPKAELPGVLRWGGVSQVRHSPMRVDSCGGGQGGHVCPGPPNSALWLSPAALAGDAGRGTAAQPCTSPPSPIPHWAGSGGTQGGAAWSSGWLMWPRGVGPESSSSVQGLRLRGPGPADTDAQVPCLPLREPRQEHRHQPARGLLPGELPRVLPSQL